MKLGLYKVNNSLGYERHTFDNIYDDPRKIEEMLQPLLDKDEAAIINLEDVESIDWFAEEYNDELYDGGWWAVTIRDYDEPKQTVWVVTFLNDCEWELPNVSVNVFGTEEEARKCLDNEWQTLTASGEYDEEVSKKTYDDFLFEDHCANRTIGEIKKKEVK